MKLPKRVLAFGVVEAIVYIKKSHTRRTTLDFLDRTPPMIIASDRHKKRLFVFPAITNRGSLKQMTDPKIDYIFSISTGNLRYSVGRVVSIQYNSDTWEGKRRSYVHEFESRPRMYADTLSRYNVIAIEPERGLILNNNGIKG